MKLKLLKRNNIYNGRVFNIIVDDVEYSSGNKTIREVAEHGGGAVALAVFPDQRVILIHQHRYPLNEFIWELPAGKLNDGEDPLACAQRELEEETGYCARHWEKITSIFTTPGFCTEVLHLYLATELFESPSGRNLEEGEESMTMSFVPLDEAIGMVEQQVIRDGKSICALLLGERMLAKQSSSSYRKQ
jgi:ADP-ribose pyrophosphatase